MTEQQVTLHARARQASEPYRFRPFRRIRNLIEHLDTECRMSDAIDAEREALMKAALPIARSEQWPRKNDADIVELRRTLGMSSVTDQQAAFPPDGPMLVMRGGKDVTREFTPKTPTGSLRAAMDSIGSSLAFHVQDHAAYHRDAWIYGIVCGWCDQHTGPNCVGDPGDEWSSCALNEVAAKHNWDESTVARLLAHRTAWKLATNDNA